MRHINHIGKYHLIGLIVHGEYPISYSKQTDYAWYGQFLKGDFGVKMGVKRRKMGVTMAVQGNVNRVID